MWHVSARWLPSIDHDKPDRSSRESDYRADNPDGKMEYHNPVMGPECIEGLNIQPNGIYVDATFGRGGHALGILDRLNDQGRLWVFDRDPEAIVSAESLAERRL